MIKKVKNNKDKINFLLENKHYQKLHLYLYFLSIIIIVSVYFLTVILFSKFTNILATGIISLIIGTFLVYNRDKLVKLIGNHLQDKKRKKNKVDNKKGLKSTLRRITPQKKSNLKLNIKEKIPLKEKIQNFKKKIKKDKSKINKKKVEYLEIK